MSVINNVLKDLESRESQFTAIEIPAIERAVGVVRSKKPFLFTAVALLVLLVAAGLFWKYPFGFEFLQSSALPDSIEDQQQPAAPVVPADESTAAIIGLAEPVVLPVAGAEPPPALVNQIVGLQIREAETEMRLEFVLRERVAAYLQERGENSFSYHLRDIDSEIVAPLIRDNPWIRQLTILQNGSGVDVNFATTTDILVETRQGEQDGQSLWIINLRAARPAPAVVAPAQAPALPAPAVVSVAVPAAAKPDVEPAAATAPAPVKLDIKSTSAVTQTTNQLDYAVELINSRRNEEAETLLGELLGGTHDYSARKHLLALYSRVNRPARLRALLQSSLLEYPQDLFFRTEYARSLFASGDYREAIAQFAGETGLDAGQQALLAASYQRLDQHEAAIRHYQFALQLDAKNARNWIGLGISQEQNAAFDAALDAYQQASRLGGLNDRLLAFVERRSSKLRQVLD